MTGDKTGTNCPQALCIKGFRAFLSVPCYGFSEGTKWHEALARAGFGVFVPCFEYWGQNRKQGTKRGQIVTRPYVSRVPRLFCLSPVTVFLRGQNGMKP